jgi:UDP-4-amino-4,6-dideoxy-N-acetyl-beta-L-altrosamine transaminase
MILYGQQNISSDDISAVNEVLTSSHLTQGEMGKNFEKKLASYCHASHAFAYSSATGALHCACLALGVGENDLVWTSTISFVASSNCALYCGAKIDFIDIDPTSGNLCVNALADKLAIAERANKLPKVIIAVHLAGQSCDMATIYQLSKQYKFHIIEDASHAIGGQYNSQPIGCCEYSDITIFSFHPVKIITTGEGGAALTQSPEIAQKLELFRSHGVTRTPELMTKDSEGPWYYQQICLGFNYRMTDIQAALGASQMDRLDAFVEKRNTIAHRYDQAFSNTNIEALTPKANCYSAYHLYLVRNKHWQGDVKKQLFEEMRNSGIQVHVHYIPIHTQPYYQALGFSAGDFPNAEQYYQQILTLPLHPDVTQEQQVYIIQELKRLSD